MNLTPVTVAAVLSDFKFVDCLSRVRRTPSQLVTKKLVAAQISKPEKHEQGAWSWEQGSERGRGSNLKDSFSSTSASSGSDTHSTVRGTVHPEEI